MMAKKEKQLSYEEALEEVEKTLAQLESNELSIDQMTEAIKKAMEHIAFCKSKLRTTEDIVNALLSKE